MARDIARGEIIIGVDLEKVGAELRHAEAQFQRTMSNIDRMRAEAKAELDTGPLKRDIAEAKAWMKTLQAEKIEPTLGMDADELKAELKKTEAQLKRLEARKIKVDIDAQGIKDANKLWRENQKAQAAAAKESLRRIKVEERQQKMWRDGVAIQQRAIDMDRKRSIEIEKLRLSYIKIHDEIEKGQRLSIFGFLGDENARVKFQRAKAELEEVGSKLRELGDSDSDLLRLARASDSATTRFRDMLSSVSSIRLQMGFFSATLRQAATGFTVLAPVLFGIAGQLVSLVGVLGTGLAGALAVSTAGVIGFAGAALGVGLIMKPMISDLQDAKKASDAYGDAVRKYGAGSTEAQTAQEKLNKTLGDIGPAAREGFQQLGQMSDRWNKLTAGNRDTFFDSFGRGIKLASSYLPMFARESNRTFQTAMAAGDEWINMFDQPEARAGIQSTLSNFRSAIPGLNAGFISLGKSIGKIGASASRWLEPLSDGFSDWAENIFQGLDKNGGLDARIDRLVEHMRQIGHFAQSAGTMLAAFFNAGADEGASLLSTLSNIFNRWTAWMNSAQGQQGLSEFFATANQIGSQFFATLGNLGLALFEFSEALAPLSQGFVVVLQAATGFTAALMGLAGARQVVTALGGALAGMFIASKLSAASAAVTMLAGSFGSLSAAAGGIGMLVASLNPLMLALAGLGASVAFFATLETEAAKASSSLSDLAASLAQTRAMIDALAGADSAAASAKLAVLAAQVRVNDATSAYRDAVKEYGRGSREAREASIYQRQALMDLHDAKLREADASQHQVMQQKKVTQAAKSDMQAINELVRKTGEAADRGPLDKIVGGFNAIGDMGRFKFSGLLNSMKDFKELVDSGASASEVHKAAMELQAKAANQLANANNKVALSQLNTKRQAMAQVPIADKLANAWNRIGDVIPRGGDTLFKIGNQKETEQLIRLTDQLRSFGRGSQAGKILLNSKSVDEALAKLRQVKNQSNILVNAKVKKGQVERDLGNLGRGKTATIQAKADTSNAKRQLAGLSGKQLAARLTIRANNREAMSALNAVERRQLRAKLVRMGADKSAVDAAIRIINQQKIPAKIAKFNAETGEAEAGNKKVQGFKDKTVSVKTRADLSGVNQAQSAINSIPNTTYKDVITRYSSQGSPGRAAGGPVGFAGGGPAPAEDRRNANTYTQANEQRNRPGVYKRPTLLVGEERQDEWVIASNPSYRAANEMYLADAAERFGYRLAPVEMAAKGKGRIPSAGTVGKGQQKYISNAQSRYTYLRGEISRLTGLATEEQADQDLMIKAGRQTDYNYPTIVNPLRKALDVYEQLKAQIRKMIGGGQGSIAKSAGIDRSINSKSLKKDRQAITDARVAERKKRREEPREKDGKKPSKEAVKRWRKEMAAAEKRTREAENRYTTNKQRDKDARANIVSKQGTVGNLQRELWQTIPNEHNALIRQINELVMMQSGMIDGPTAGGSSDPIGIQMGALDKNRYDLFNQYASNVMSSGALAAGSMPGGPLGPGSSSSPSPLLGPSPAAPSFYSTPAGSAAASGYRASAPTGGATGGSGFGGTTVNQTINMQTPPPDPHSFSKQLGWEAAAMLG